MRRHAMESKRTQELKYRNPKKLHKRLVEHRVERLKEVFSIEVRQFAITAASTTQLQVWIEQSIKSTTNGQEVSDFKDYLTSMALADMTEILVDADPAWPLVRISKEIEELHQRRASLGIVELLQRAYEVYARVVVGERLRRRPFRGIWCVEIPSLVLDDCIRLGWKDPSWPVDRTAKRIEFGPHLVTEDFKTRFLAALAAPIERWSKRMEAIAVDDRELIGEGESEASFIAESEPQREGQFGTSATVKPDLRSSPLFVERAARRQAVVNPILEEKSWTRGRLATEAGLGKNSVYQYLNGTRRKITPENRKAIADVLGLTEELLPD